jgi:signal transduction histidine kinase
VSLLAQIHLLIGVLFALVLITAAGTFALSQRIENVTNHLTNVIHPARTAVTELTRAYTDQANDVRGFLLSGDRSFLQADGARQAESARFRNIAGEQLADDPVSVRILGQIDSAAQVWRSQSVNPEINAASNGTPPNRLASDSLDEEGRFATLRARLADLDDRLNQVSAQEGARVDSARAATDRLTLATIAVAVAVAISTIFFLRRALTRPLTGLVTEVSEVAGGDLERPVRRFGPPELATVASAVESMRVRILEQTNRASQSRQQLARYDEAERIAGGLQDEVIQRLVGTGLLLQSIAGRHPALGRELSNAIGNMDRVVQELRIVIFGLTGSPAGGVGLRQSVLDLVRESESSLGFPPQVTFNGVIDAVTVDSVAQELVPVIREALSNIARHAHAGWAEVSLTTTEDELILHVADDGRGMSPERIRTGEGLTNLRRRAERLGGTCTIESAPAQGTAIDWRVPLPSSNA